MNENHDNLKVELIEGYQSTYEENIALTKEFEWADSENVCRDIQR